MDEGRERCERCVFECKADGRLWGLELGIENKNENENEIEKGEREELKGKKGVKSRNDHFLNLVE